MAVRISTHVGSGHSVESASTIAENAANKELKDEKLVSVEVQTFVHDERYHHVITLVLELPKEGQPFRAAVGGNRMPNVPQ